MSTKSAATLGAKAVDYVAKHKADTESKVEALKAKRSVELQAYVQALTPEVRRAYDALGGLSEPK